MSGKNEKTIGETMLELKEQFGYWEKTKDCVDQFIDIILNYRQSGHPGGSRSKAHALIATLLGGIMKWDIRHPEKRFADRFVLGAGHTIPLIYATLAVLNEALRVKYEQTGDTRYLNPQARERILYWEDLLGFRSRGGLSGHAEMSGKTLFLKFNTGPSGHGSPAAAGIALALKRAGADGVKVFLFEGEGGLTPGATHETANSAWGLALDNLHFVVDWNDFGIDSHKVSSVVYGTPEDWFAPHGWKVFGAENGSDWEQVSEALWKMLLSENPERVPSVTWVKTRKGREYLKYDNASHGAPHAMNSDLFWETKKVFADKYGATFANFGGPAPAGAAEKKAEFTANLKAVADVLRADQSLIDYLAERLVEIGESVPDSTAGFGLQKNGNPFSDPRLYDFENYPEDMYAAPGSSMANRNALAKWGAWVNAFGAQEYGRPLFLACSADLAGSTNISGFASEYGDFKGYGWYERVGSKEGSPASSGNHGIHQHGHSRRRGIGQFCDAARRGVRRFLGSGLYLWIVLLSQVRPYASVQPALPGLRTQDRKGHLGGRSLRSGNGGRFTYPLRDLFSGGNTALPGRACHQSSSLGIQRGTCSDCRCPEDGCTDYRAAPYPAGS